MITCDKFCKLVNLMCTNNKSIDELCGFFGGLDLGSEADLFVVFNSIPEMFEEDVVGDVDEYYEEFWNMVCGDNWDLAKEFYENWFGLCKTKPGESEDEGEANDIIRHAYLRYWENMNLKDGENQNQTTISWDNWNWREYDSDKICNDYTDDKVCNDYASIDNNIWDTRDGNSVNFYCNCATGEGYYKIAVNGNEK